MRKSDDEIKFEAAICQKLNTGFEWLDKNRANMNDADKRVVDEFKRAIFMLALQCGYRVTKNS